MTDHPHPDHLIDIALAYFQRADAGKASLWDLFQPDVEIYVPAIGLLHGVDHLKALTATIAERPDRFWHVQESLTPTAHGDRVVVEGVLGGRNADGVDWPSADAPNAVRFCNVFAFRDGKIQRLHLHANPHFASPASADADTTEEDAR